MEIFLIEISTRNRVEKLPIPTPLRLSKLFPPRFRKLVDSKWFSKRETVTPVEMDKMSRTKLAKTKV